MPLPLYNKKDPLSIFQYSGLLLDHSLAEVVNAFDTDTVIEELSNEGKGKLGNLVEKYFFGYEPNSSPQPDFSEAGLELKVTPLKRLKNQKLAIKERLVCDMIDYMTVINEEFEESKFFKKSVLMLIIFYLHLNGFKKQDLRFIYSVLWKIKDKDLAILKNDFIVIRDKVRQGKAHELSEGDTMYLGACRKGQKGQPPRQQPNSETLAPARAFSFKTTYMRTILNYVRNNSSHMASNLTNAELPGIERIITRDTYNRICSDPGEIELVSEDQLNKSTFDEVVINRIMEFKGLTANEILARLGFEESNAKHLNYYALCKIFGVASLEKAEEIIKSGIRVKTIRINKFGTVKESMSFENIDYEEVYEKDDWIDSDWYNIVTSRFLFVVFRQSKDDDKRYTLDRAFFWTMPTEDLKIAEQYWLNIRENVLNDTLQDRITAKTENKANTFWTLAEDRNFHVRPKAQKSENRYLSPISGEEVPKKAYWFNSSYISQKLKDEYGNEWQDLFITR